MSESVRNETTVRLIVIRGETAGKSFNIVEGENLIGRWDPEAGAFPEVDLDAEDVDAKISRKHAVLERRGTKLVLTDVGSLNGTFINRGPKLSHGAKHELIHGDEVIIGKTFLKVEIS